MATHLESTTPRALPAFRREICFDRTTRDYTMILDGETIGTARTHHDAEITLDTLVLEILTLYAAAPAHPLPPPDAIAEALDDLAALPTDQAPHFAQARARLAAGVPLAAGLSGVHIAGVLVQPTPARVGWPWRCACGPAPCWHAALAEALAVARERLADAQESADHYALVA